MTFSLTNFHQILHGLSVEDILSISSNGTALLNKMVIMPYLKKKLLLQNQESWGWIFITKTRLFKYIENFTTKQWIFSGWKFWYISYFCSKHGLWVLVRTPIRGGSNEYPQSMFFSRNEKNNVYPCKPQFYYIKVGFNVVKIIWACFRNVVYSIGDARSTKFVQMILGLPLTFFRRSQISVLVAVAILVECCMASADMQWLIYSGERIEAHGPPVSYS